MGHSLWGPKESDRTEQDPKETEVVVAERKTKEMLTTDVAHARSVMESRSFECRPNIKEGEEVLKFVTNLASFLRDQE